MTAWTSTVGSSHWIIDIVPSHSVTCYCWQMYLDTTHNWNLTADSTQVCLLQKCDFRRTSWHHRQLWTDLFECSQYACGVIWLLENQYESRYLNEDLADELQVSAYVSNAIQPSHIWHFHWRELCQHWDSIWKVHRTQCNIMWMRLFMFWSKIHHHLIQSVTLTSVNCFCSGLSDRKLFPYDLWGLTATSLKLSGQWLNWRPWRINVWLVSVSYTHLTLPTKRIV